MQDFSDLQFEINKLDSYATCLNIFITLHVNNTNENPFNSVRIRSSMPKISYETF